MKKKKKKIIVLFLVTALVFTGSIIFGFSYSKNYGYAQTLRKAIDTDDLDKLDNLLNKKGNINSRTTILSLPLLESNDDPMLLYACLINKFDAAIILLEHGADPNIEKKDESALILCPYNAKKEDTEKMLFVMNLLVENGADVNYKTSQGVTVLSSVLLGLNTGVGRLDDDTIYSALKLLVDNGADFESTYAGGSILLNNFVYTSPAFVEYLITQKNADIGVTDEYFNTPLIVAVKIKAIESVELLLKKGADKKHKIVMAKLLWIMQ